MPEVPPYRPPATRDEVPMIRLLGGHFDQQHRLIEHVCCCPVPCNSYKCPNQQYLAPPTPSAPTMAEAMERERRDPPDEDFQQGAS